MLRSSGEDLVKSCPPPLICFPSSVAHLLLASSVAAATASNRQIQATIKPARRRRCRSSKTPFGATAIRGLMKSDSGWDRKSALELRQDETVADAGRRLGTGQTSPIWSDEAGTARTLVPSFGGGARMKQRFQLILDQPGGVGGGQTFLFCSTAVRRSGGVGENSNRLLQC